MNEKIRVAKEGILATKGIPKFVLVPSAVIYDLTGCHPRCPHCRWVTADNLPHNPNCALFKSLENLTAEEWGAWWLELRMQENK